MKIYIPTYKRTQRQVTLRNLPARWRKNTFLVAPKEDINALKFYNRQLLETSGGIIEQPEHIKTIAAKRAWIIEQCDSEKMMMFDDDIKFNIRINPETFHLRQQDPEDAEVDLLLQELCDKLDTYHHAGISPRQGNNRMAYGWLENTRMIYAMAFRTETAKTMELGRINTREDMDYTLQLLRRGFPNTICTKFACSPLGFNADGGASTERTVESSNADAEKLVELHPGFVRVAEKKYTTSMPRKEVVVSWKKAFASSQKDYDDKAKFEESE